jgi:hypothetical protein
LNLGIAGRVRGTFHDLSITFDNGVAAIQNLERAQLRQMRSQRSKVAPRAAQPQPDRLAYGRVTRFQSSPGSRELQPRIPLD